MPDVLPQLPGTAVGIQGWAWIENIQQMNFVDNEYVGTRDEGLRMEGFAINLVDPPGTLGIQYAVYASGIGWMPAVDGGTFAGTQGQARGLQAVTIALLNPDQPDESGNNWHYWLEYLVHQENNGDVETGPYGDGAQLPIGGAGSGLRLEGLELTIQRQQGNPL